MNVRDGAQGGFQHKPASNNCEFYGIRDSERETEQEKQLLPVQGKGAVRRPPGREKGSLGKVPVLGHRHVRGAPFHLIFLGQELRVHEAPCGSKNTWAPGAGTQRAGGLTCSDPHAPDPCTVQGLGWKGGDSAAQGDQPEQSVTL